MLRNFGLQLAFLLTVSIACSEARSVNEVDLHNVNVACKPTKCPKMCPTGSGGYHYYYKTNSSCLRCICGRPKGLADCGEDINPSLCNFVAIYEECEKNSTVRQSCNFSCSQSGQLWWAASRGNPAAVSTAIAAGGNPLCQRTYDLSLPNATALHLAACFNHPGVAVALLDAAVDVNLQDAFGLTPTYFASYNGSIETLNVLIEHNADINTADSDGWTPLMVASRRGHLSIAKALINTNASFDVTGGWYNATALYYATFNTHPDIALLLIEHNADVNIAASDGFTPLMVAARWGLLNETKVLINANASLDVTGGFENGTALYYAIYGNETDIALLLIEHNADVNIAAYDGFTPLMQAARRGLLNVTKALINANADVNMVAIYGMTALMQAAYEGQLSAAKALINANASLDVTGGPHFATALSYAAAMDSKDVAILLLKSGADTMIPDGDGQTPAETARHNGYDQLADIIESYSKITSTTMEDIVNSSSSIGTD